MRRLVTIAMALMVPEEVAKAAGSIIIALRP
jgi:hypothetical protein